MKVVITAVKKFYITGPSERFLREGKTCWNSYEVVLCQNQKIFGSREREREREREEETLQVV